MFSHLHHLFSVRPLLKSHYLLFLYLDDLESHVYSFTILYSNLSILPMFQYISNTLYPSDIENKIYGQTLQIITCIYNKIYLDLRTYLLLEVVRSIFCCIGQSSDNVNRTILNYDRTWTHYYYFHYSLKPKTYVKPQTTVFETRTYHTPHTPLPSRSPTYPSLTMVYYSV